MAIIKKYESLRILRKEEKISNFAIEYLSESEKFCCLYGAHVASFKPKQMVENLVTLSL